MGAEGARGAVESRRDRAGGHRRGAHGPLAACGRRLRRPKPGAARAGGRRRPQRHADDAPAGARAGFDSDGGHIQRQLDAWRVNRTHPRWRGCGRLRSLAPRGSGRAHRGRGGIGRLRPLPPRGSLLSSLQVRGRRARRGGRGEGLRRSRTAVPPPGALAYTRAPGAARERADLPGGARAGRGARVRLARVRLPQRPARAAAADRRPLDPRGDRAPVRAGGAARVVAQRVRRPPHRRARAHAVADRARRGLAHAGRLGDARAALLHRLAVAVVCDLAATAGRPQRQPPPARGHAPLLPLRPADPPAAGQTAALPAAPPRAQTSPDGET